MEFSKKTRVLLGALFFFIVISVIMITVIFLSASISAMSNPAAVYCEELGYNYENSKKEGNEKGFCSINESLKFDAWEFFKGKAGKNYSYCAKKGYNTETVRGNGSLSQEYSVCVTDKAPSSSKVSVSSKEDSTKKVTELMDLKGKISSIQKNPSEIKIERAKHSSSEEEIKEKRSKEKKSIPGSFDWRDFNDSNWLTPVKAQGTCGSCWAFSSLGQIESKIKISRENPNFEVDLSEEYLVSDCFGEDDCGGEFPRKALNFVKNKGITDESCFPYKSSSASKCSERCSSWEERIWKVDRVKKISDNSERERIKNVLIEKGPLITGVKMDGRFNSKGIYNCGSASSGHHAVLITGYNDTGEYWRLKNSWGSNWGPENNGYFKMGYGECGVEGYLPFSYTEINKEQEKERIGFSREKSTNDTREEFLNQTYSKDGKYLSFSENFSKNVSTPNLDNVKSINVFSNQKKSKSNNFNISIFNSKRKGLLDIITLPLTDSIVKYNLCNSRENCSKYSYSELILKYIGSSVSEKVKIDSLFLEVLPSYCTISGNKSNNSWISSVKLNTGKKSSENSAYSDFTDNEFTYLNKNKSYTLNITARTKNNITEYIKAWIDFNNNGKFSKNEKLKLGNETFNGTHNFVKNFSVPGNINSSKTRMRVYLDKLGKNNTSGSCVSPSNGEVEDYKVCFTEWVRENKTCTINNTRETHYIDINNCTTLEENSSKKATKESNKTYTCDYCEPNWLEKSLVKCFPNDTGVFEYEDSNNCYNKTGLSSDLEGKPKNKTIEYSCDYNSDGIIGNTGDINSETNITNERYNKSMVFFQKNKTLFKFKINNNSGINLAKTFVKKGTNNSSYMILDGFGFPEDKTIFLNKTTNDSGLCIKNKKINSTNEFSEDCKGQNETFIKCPTNKENYSCKLVNNKSTYRIEGENIFGISEQKSYCGNDVCESNENCSCSDCKNMDKCNSDGESDENDDGGDGGGGLGDVTTETKNIRKKETNQTNINKTKNKTEDNSAEKNETAKRINKTDTNKTKSSNVKINQTNKKRLTGITGAVVGQKIRENKILLISISIAIIMISLILLYDASRK